MKPTFVILVFTLIWSSGSSLIAQSNLTKYEQLQNELAEARKSKDQKALAEIYFSLAEFEKDKLAQDAKSFENFTRSADYFKILQDTASYMRAQRKIAEHFSQSENFSAAESIFQDISRWYFEKDLIQDFCEVNIDLASLYADNKEIEKQNEILLDLKNTNEDLQNPKIDFEINLQKIEQYYHEGRIKKALETALDIFKKSNELGFDDYKHKSLFHIGYGNHLIGDHRRAVNYLNKSFRFTELKPLDKERMFIYDILSKSYAKLNYHQQAYQHAQKYASLKDSILNKERTKSISDITYKYESKKKNTEIKLLEQEKDFEVSKFAQQRRIMYTLFSALGLLILSIYYIVRFYTEKMKVNKIITSQRDEISDQKLLDLQNQMKINSMQSMIDGQEQERDRIARDLHDSLGGLLSTIKLQFGNLENKIKKVQQADAYIKANELLDTAVKEVRFISQNLQPGALHDLGLISAIKDLVNRAQSVSGPEIDLQHYEIPQNLDSMISLNIYRIIQELLNNAIKYAQAKEILIQLTKEEEDIVILFEDDGIGFDMDNIKEKGMGMENIQSRINYLKGSFHIDSRPNEGTSFMIHVKHDLNTKNP